MVLNMLKDRPLGAGPLQFSAGVFVACLLVGCDSPVGSFDRNQLFAKRLELSERVDLAPVGEQIDRILEELFGTPNQPAWPSFLEETPELAQLISLQRLSRAGGAVRSDESDRHFGLYREHCLACHGTSGNGLGPTSKLLNPYPRDFRMGKYKFKSTPHGSKPTRADLAKTLRSGLAGTSMPAFGLVADEDLQALVDYIIYLSIRGEVERSLLAWATYDLDLESEPRIGLGQSDNASDELAARRQHIRDVVTKVALAWQHADVSVTPVVPPPAALFDLEGGFVLESGGGARSRAVVESIARGRELFRGKVANCASCHGLDAAGDGLVSDYDDWTKDWTLQAGLDPADKRQLLPMLQRGALPPRNILPRNLQTGVFRGGCLPRDLFLRIVNGIEGTPMPAAPRQPENSLGLSDADIWDLVSYLLSLSSVGPTG